MALEELSVPNLSLLMLLKLKHLRFEKLVLLQKILVDVLTQSCEKFSPSHLNLTPNSYQKLRTSFLRFKFPGKGVRPRKTKKSRQGK